MDGDGVVGSAEYEELLISQEDWHICRVGCGEEHPCEQFYHLSRVWQHASL